MSNVDPEERVHVDRSGVIHARRWCAALVAVGRAPGAGIDPGADFCACVTAGDDVRGQLANLRSVAAEVLELDTQEGSRLMVGLANHAATFLDTFPGVGAREQEKVRKEVTSVVKGLVLPLLELEALHLRSGGALALVDLAAVSQRYEVPSSDVVLKAVRKRLRRPAHEPLVVSAHGFDVLDDLGVIHASATVNADLARACSVAEVVGVMRAQDEDGPWSDLGLAVRAAQELV